MRSLTVYILQCSDDTYYTGVTNNLERRLKEHQQAVNPGCYTASRLPVTLVYSESIKNPIKAIEAEKQLKNWSRKKKEALIAGRLELLPQLAKKKFRKGGVDG